jgi:cytochrome c oxidase assembly protein subunit 15
VVGLSLMLLMGIPLQAVIGGITVLTDLNPWVVSLHLLLSLGLVALATVLIRARARIAAQWDVAVVLAAAPVLLIVALHFAAYRNLRIEPGNPVIVGRYLFPVLPLFGIAIALVVRALPVRVSAAAGTALLFTGALLGLSGLGMTVVRFYV